MFETGRECRFTPAPRAIDSWHYNSQDAQRSLAFLRSTGELQLPGSSAHAQTCACATGLPAPEAAAERSVTWGGSD